MKFINLVIVSICLFCFTFGNLEAAGLSCDSKTLPNGIKLIYQVIPSAKTTTARVVFPVGYLNEPKRLRGISHLLEHLIYRGNEQISFPKFRKLVNDEGGYYNGFTMINRTEYYLNIPTEKFIPAFNAYLEMITRPALNETDIELEKKIVTVEKALRDYSANSFIFYFNELTQQQLQDTMESIHRSDIFQYHQQFYTPQQMTVIVTGAFNSKEIIKQLTNLEFNINNSTQMKPILPDWEIYNTKQDIELVDHLLGEKYQLLFGMDLKELSGDDLLVAKVLPLILYYDSRNYDHLTNKPLDYDIFILNLKQHYYLIMGYRDYQEPYSTELERWHQRNLERYCKYLKTKKLDRFLERISKSYDNFFELAESNPVLLNDLITDSIFEPSAINANELSKIKRLSNKDIKSFVEKHIEDKKFNKILIKSL